AFAVRSPMAAFMPVLVFPVLILAASTRETLIGRLASWPPLVAVGAASYSLYLMQAPVQTAMKPFQDYVSLAAPGLSVLIVLAYIGVLAAGTVLVYRCVERPCRRVLRRRIGKPMPA
ncbi:MAG: acyltransferase family protein, partial [Acetobacteraceae bacterium]